MKFFTSKLKSSADFYSQIALMLAVVILVEFIFTLLPLRLDVSEARVYSLSPVTRDTLKQLNDVVTIKGYFTKDVPGYLVTVRDQVQDMLKEYRAYGGGNIRISFINPNESPEKAQEAQMLGIPPLQFNVIKKDKLEVGEGYMGVALLYGAKREVVPVVKDIATLEFDLTAAIKKVISGKALTVGIAEFPDHASEQGELRILKEVLGQQYAVEFIDISKGDLIPEQITTLIVPGARGSWSKRQLYILDQFVMSGRGVLFLVDGISVDNSLRGTPNTTNVLDLLKSYGVTINKDFIYDSVYQARASFSSGQEFFSFVTPYGFWVNVPPTSLNKDNPLVNKLESVMFPWVSSISLKEEKGVETLVKTSDKSKIVSDPSDLSPQSEPAVSGNGGYPVAVSLNTQLSSYFNAPVPRDEKSAGGNEPEFIKKTDRARMMVVSDGDMITDAFMNRFGSDVLFIQNLADGLTLDATLATIRSKSVTERPIRPLDDTARALLKYGNIVGAPLVVVLFAIARFAWRRKIQQI